MSDPKPLDYESRVKPPEPEPRRQPIKRSSITAICPKCQGQMEHGYVIDNAHAGTRVQAAWVPGAPQRGVFGVKVPKLCPLFAWRCSQCGFVEFYAFDPEEELDPSEEND